MADDEAGDRVQPGGSDQRAFEGHICVESAGGLLRRRERGAEVIDPGLSAGSQHPDDLVEAGRWVVPVVEAEGGDDEVDGVVGERQRSDVAMRKRRLLVRVLLAVEVARAIISGDRSTLRPQPWDRPRR